MFENLKTGNMVKKLIKLSKYNEQLKEYDKRLKDFVPKNVLTKDICEYFIGYSNFMYSEYVLTLNNISYIFDEKERYYIKINNITILEAYESFRGLNIQWNHKLPKEMLSQIKEDSKTIEDYIKTIKKYMKNNKTTEQSRYYEEQEELEKIFCDK